MPALQRINFQLIDWNRTSEKEAVVIAMIISLVLFPFLASLYYFLVHPFWYSWVQGFCFIAVSALILANSVRNIPAAPPYKGVITVMGKKEMNYKDEGLRLIAPWAGYDVILVKVEKVNKDFPEIRIRVGKQAEMGIGVSITFTPDEDNMNAYINSGGEDGFVDIIDDIIFEEIRIWAATKKWTTVLKSREKILRELIKAILKASQGEAPEEMMSDEVLEALLDSNLTKIRVGNGKCKMRAWGVILNRLNLRDVTVLGELAKAAEIIEVEDRQRKGEEIEAKHLANIINIVKGSDLTAQQALEAVQVERKKIQKSVDQKTLNVTGDQLQSLGDIFLGLLRGRQQS